MSIACLGFWRWFNFNQIPLSLWWGNLISTILLWLFYIFDWAFLWFTAMWNTTIAKSTRTDHFIDFINLGQEFFLFFILLFFVVYFFIFSFHWWLSQEFSWCLYASFEDTVYEFSSFCFAFSFLILGFHVTIFIELFFELLKFITFFLFLWFGNWRWVSGRSIIFQFFLALFIRWLRFWFWIRFRFLAFLCRGSSLSWLIHDVCKFLFNFLVPILFFRWITCWWF